MGYCTTVCSFALFEWNLFPSTRFGYIGCYTPKNATALKGVVFLWKYLCFGPIAPACVTQEQPQWLLKQIHLPPFWSFWQLNPVGQEQPQWLLKQIHLPPFRSFWQLNPVGQEQPQWLLKQIHLPPFWSFWQLNPVGQEQPQWLLKQIHGLFATILFETSPCTSNCAVAMPHNCSHLFLS